MKKVGTLNQPLSEVIAGLGHMADYFSTVRSLSRSRLFPQPNSGLAADRLAAGRISPDRWQDVRNGVFGDVFCPGSSWSRGNCGLCPPERREAQRRSIPLASSPRQNLTVIEDFNPHISVLGFVSAQDL